MLADGPAGALLLQNAEYLKSLASASEVALTDQRSDIPEDCVAAVVQGAEIFMPLDDLIDYKKELERLTREQGKLQQEIDRVTAKLSNEGFVAKAPEKLIQEEKDKQQKFAEMLAKVTERLNAVAAKLK